MNTDNVAKLAAEIKNGRRISSEEALALVGAPLEPLCSAADAIRAHYCRDSFDMCSIINGKSGRCSENCRYCAQSAHYCGSCEEYPLMNAQQLLEGAQYNEKRGVCRFSVVTSGKRLSGAEVDSICESYREMSERCGISLCASHGLLCYEDFLKLKAAGVTRYHNNLETSRRYFPSICTTHTYDEKLAAIRAAQRAGLEVCSGGIMGLGEAWEDRVDMALELRGLGIRSVPLNVLNPIKGTPLGNSEPLCEDEVCRIAAIWRFILPEAKIRLAGGRGLFPDKGERIFRSGANAAITGDMLTTSGITIADDIALVKKLGYEVKLS
ncbi:MAG: biotin synthase BioB [Oscillospiraceae bacterium]